MQQPEIISRADAKARGLKHYFTGKACANGGIAQRRTGSKQCTCSGCKEKSSKQQKAWRTSMATHVSEVKRANYSLNRASIRDRQATYYQGNRDRLLSASVERGRLDPQKARDRTKAHRKEKPHLHAASDAKRRAFKLNATPAWLTPDHYAQIAAVYALARQLAEQTGDPHHVDHIVPLIHPDVCGLHVPWNLQAIPANDNLKKSNKLTAA